MLMSKGVLENKDRRIDMLHARYYIVSEWDSRYMDFRNQPHRFRFLYTFGDTDVYENLRALPPAYVVPVSGIEVIPDEAQQLLRVKDPNFDAERCVVLSEAPPEAATGEGRARRRQRPTAGRPARRRPVPVPSPRSHGCSAGCSRSGWR